MTISTELLTPVLALITWSMVMWGWMYATRIPAIQAAKIRLDSNAPSGQQMATLPAPVRWKADNYNHLMEQPTLYYALVLTLALLGVADSLTLGLAWAYVALRVIHSLVQSLSNVIIVRFAVFSLSSLVLIGLVIQAWLAI
ncbi:MAG: MAPEG family protein [Paraperlucidibaca sp.]